MAPLMGAWKQKFGVLSTFTYLRRDVEIDEHIWNKSLCYSMAKLSNTKIYVDTSATSTKQCEAITNVAIRVMRLKRLKRDG